MSPLSAWDPRQVRGILFDLDGTLVDSAPDLAGTANDMRATRGLPPLPYARLRPMVGSGARGMLAVALEVGVEHPQFEALRGEFLDRYERRMLHDTRVFADVEPVLTHLESVSLPWGIVTNKHERFALPVTEALGLASRTPSIVGGDTTPHAKPHPAPLLEGARRLQQDPAQCLYVGDDERDIQAGRAAGMRTVAVAWGYLGLGKPIEDWDADHVIFHPQELLKLLQLA